MNYLKEKKANIPQSLPSIQMYENTKQGIHIF